MSEELNLALVVLGVGMITVFVILGLVVLTGHFLIKVVNRFFPAASIKSPLNNPSLNAPIASSSVSQPKSRSAAIVAAVDLMTGGKGKVEKIEKMNWNIQF